MQCSNKYRLIVWIVCLTVALAPSSAVLAETVVVPEDTMVYAVLPQDVSSKKKETNVGDVVHAHVWRDVEINGEVVIEEGAEMLLRVSFAKKAKMLGRKGRLELEAISVKARDGRDLPLTGFYYQTGKGRKVATGVLAVAVAWPFLFMKGKNARVDEGTVFEAYVLEEAEVGAL